MAHPQAYQQQQQQQQQQQPPQIQQQQPQQQQTQVPPFHQAQQTGFRPGAAPAGLTGMRAMSPPVTSPVGQSPRMPHRVGSPSVQATPPGTQSPTLSYASSAPQSPTHPAAPHPHRARQKRMYPEQITSAYTEPAYPSASPIPQAYPPPVQQQQQQQQPQYQQQQQPQYQQQQQQQQQQPLLNQFGQMSLQNTTAQSVPLIGAGPAIEDLQQPPPAIQLPPNTSITPSPFANADPSYQCCTLNTIPATDSLLKKSKLPLALVLSPYRTADKGKQDDVIVIRDNVIARCRRCRTYINPFVTFVEGGQRWKCNMCFLLNDVPAAFDYDPQTQQPADRWQRPELNYACVEYVAPTEYMVRPPQAPAYVFVLDVSFSAIQSGMLDVASRTLLDSLDRIPNKDGRTRVAFLAVDSALHFFSLDPSRTEPTMLVVSDLEDIYLPDPASLLAPLATCRTAINALLAKLPRMFKDTLNQHNALGTALEAAFKIVSPYGGKIVCLQSTLPDMSTGALKPREDTKLYGTSKESQLLNPSSPFFKSFPVECSRSQVACDMLVFGGQYADLATLSCLPHYTGGQTYYYPGFSADQPEDVAKLTHEFGELLAEEIGLEAVLRVRASRNLRMSAFHGNFFIRSSDLLALPNVPRNQSYCIEVEIEDDLRGPTACFQSALLHTNCYGERRIRVITLCLPVTQSIAECCTGMNPYAVTAYLANKGVERGISSKLEDARDAILHKCGEILGTYKTHVLGMGKSASTNQLTVPASLKLLPLLVLALIKHDALRQTTTPVPSDARTNAMNLLRTMPIQLLIPYLVPNLYALHALAPPAPNALFPPSLNLTQASLEAHGCYLLEDGQTLSIWVGRGVVPQLCVDLFGVKGYTEIQNGKATLPVLDTAISKRTHGLIHTLRAVRRGNYYPVVYIVKEDSDPLTRSRFLGRLLEDRTDTMHSYQQFLQFMKDKVNYVTS